jgi:type II secretory pathway pseudopilin PulG
MYRNTLFTKRSGFTLMELLLVMVILIALFAMVMPALMNSQKNARIKEATIRIKNFEGALETYATENRGYPTTEQGLDALIFLPDNYGQMQPGQMQPGGMNPMIQPGDGGMGTGTGAFGAGEATAVGPELLNNGGGFSGGGGMGGAGGTAMPMQPNIGGGGGMGMTDPSIGMGIGGGMGMTDPSVGTGIGGTGMGTTGTLGGWTQPLSNPQLYTQKRQRPVKYLDANEIPSDPWGQPYRYDNSMQYGGVNQTGTAQPAIWSAGPDKQDGNDDDIRNWDPVVAQNLIAQRQQQVQQQGYGGMTNPQTGMTENLMDPTNPMGTPTGMPNPMGTPTGMPNPMGTPTGMPNPMGTPTGMPNPMGTPTGMPNPMGTPTGMPNPMGTPTGMPNPMGTPTGMPPSPMGPGT